MKTMTTNYGDVLVLSWCCAY